MTNSQRPAWKTKYGSRRVRHDPPTLAEAVAAAKDLTEEFDQQVDIAASLMGISREQAMAEWPKSAPQLKMTSSVTFAATRGGVQRAVVVERKPSRRIVPRGVLPGSKLNSAS